MDNTEVRLTDAVFDVRFERKAEQVGDGSWKNVDFIILTWDNGATQLPVRLVDGEEQAERMKMRFSAQYKQWLETQENTPIGFPLKKFFESNPALVKTYEAAYIHTVEQLAAASDASISGLGAQAHEDRKKCAEFVRARTIASTSDALVVEMNALKAELEQMRQENRELSSKFVTRETEDTGVVKRSPGRPKKVEN